MGYVKGIDISNNNGSIDFSKVASDGIEYVYMKATEGTTFQDDTMETFYSESKNNNLKVGAYHFLVGTSTPENQAQNFYGKIKGFDWDLIPMLDVETNFNNLSNYVERFISEFNKLSSLTLGIYSYTSFIENIEDIEDVIKDMPFWEANYNNNPWSLPANFFNNRVGHQYTDAGHVNGISGTCDLDAFTDGILVDNTAKPGKWILQDGKWWYKHDDGTYTKNGWEKINGKWYLFDSDGWMLYDWKKSKGSWYYLGRSDDGAMKSGWVLQGDKWYYLGEKDDGAMKSGWILQANKWYYLGSSDDGSMKIGWQKIDGKWYYFNSNGQMQTGWISYKGQYYCMYSDGSMINNCDLYGYHFDENGVATKIN